MPAMSPREIEEFLVGPHQAVLSVGRVGRGPVAVPMSYLFEGDRFRMITSPESLHGRLMRQTRCATLTIHAEDYPDRSSFQWYIMAEGPVAFTDEPPLELLRAILAKDRGSALADEWTKQMAPDVDVVAVLTPRTLSGYTFATHLR